MAVMGQQKHLKPSSTNEVSICQIRSNVTKLLDQELEVNAVLVNGFEMFVLKDAVECNVEESKKHSFLFLFDEDFRQKSSKPTLEKFDKLMKRKIDRGSIVRKVAGRFAIKVEKYAPSNDLDKRAEFQIVILKILSVNH